MEAGTRDAMRRVYTIEDVSTINQLVTIGLIAQGDAYRYVCESFQMGALERLIGLRWVYDEFGCESEFNITASHLMWIECFLRYGAELNGELKLDINSLRQACEYEYHSVVCAIAAAGVIAPTGELHARALEMIIREPYPWFKCATAKLIKTRRAAARAAAGWPDHENALARLAARDPSAEVLWDALHEEAEAAATRDAMLNGAALRKEATLEGAPIEGEAAREESKAVLGAQGVSD